MHPTLFLRKLIRDDCQTIHKTRLFSLFDAVKALTKGKKLTLVDWSPITKCGQFHVLRASTPIDGRALTIYEETHLQSEYDTPKTNLVFLQNLKSVIPVDCKPIVITDAGFRNPWFKLIISFEWDFGGRLRGNAYLSETNDPHVWRHCKELYSKSTSKAQFCGKYLVAKSNPVSANIFQIKLKPKNRIRRTVFGVRALCSHSLQHSERENEPWLIMSSLSKRLTKEAIAIYRTRMKIEQSFRDLKSHRFGFSFSDEYNKKTGCDFNLFPWLPTY